MRIPVATRAPMRGYTCAALYEAGRRVSDHTSNRTGSGSARAAARRRRLLMQVLVFVRLTLIDTTLVCFRLEQKPPNVLILAFAE